MASYKVDYSDLVLALQEGREEEANSLLKKLLPALKTYLITVMNASPADAEEAAHRGLAIVHEKIMQDEIRNKKYLYKYILTVCKHEYFHFYKKKRAYSYDSIALDELPASPAQQIHNLLEKERKQVLKKCLKKLPKESRDFITYIIQHPKTHSEKLADRFNMTSANVRVKKFRIIRKLNKCVERKLNR